MSTTNQLSRAAIVLLCVITCAQAAETPPATKPASTQPQAKPFKPEEYEQLVAQIALYPDSLVAQVLMASTYPVEVIQAERWIADEKNKALKGDALATALNAEDWDASVKSLVNFPQVLTMMSKQLDWTIKLGDAFIADQKAVMAAVQKLRAKAQANGALKDSKEQKVTVEKAPPEVIVVEGAAPQVIKIESTSPDVIYVPTYNPTVVYGAWPYPAYPPYPPYYPPGYVATGMISFGLGVACGAAWGHAWGGCNWHGGEVDIDVDRNTNFNRNINRESARTNIQSRQTNRTGTGGAGRTGTGAQGRSSFQHDPSHRKGASYRDASSANRVGASQSNLGAAQARDSYRGRAEAGRADIARGGADSFRGTGGNVANTANRAASPGRTQAPSNAFDSANRSGAQAKSSSSRGQTSRASPPPSRSSSSVNRGGGGSSGGSRGGGGASRGGGGGGGRGGGGRR